MQFCLEETIRMFIHESTQKLCISLDKFYEIGRDLSKDLKKGDLVSKAGGCKYIIDNPGAVLDLFVEGNSIPYTKIHNFFFPNQPEIRELFRQDKIIPFSKMVNACLGECLEKAIAMQIVLQSLPGFEKASIVAGNMRPKGEEYLECHAYNIAKHEGQWGIIDVENPLLKNNGNIVPFITPAAEISGRKIITPGYNGREYFVNLPEKKPLNKIPHF